MSDVGSPRCSLTITMSEKSFALHAFTSYPSSSPPAPTSSSLDAPRLTRCEFGIISLISLMNIFRRELGSREVVTQTLGSSIPAVAYSSSACVYTVTRLPGRQTFSSFVLSSSISTTCFSFSASYRSSVGTFFPARHHPIRRALTCQCVANLLLLLVLLLLFSLQRLAIQVLLSQTDVSAKHLDYQRTRTTETIKPMLLNGLLWKEPDCPKSAGFLKTRRFAVSNKQKQRTS